jgi:hypothetical protein
LFAREVDLSPAVLHDLRSISKSVVGLLVGIARERGAIDLSAPALSPGIPIVIGGVSRAAIRRAARVGDGR